jgi:nucleoside phosphorylase
MKLLIFAHKGEASAFFKHFSYEASKDRFYDIFKAKDHHLLICKEGMIDSLVNTVDCLAHFQYDEVINLGIAASLRSDLKKGEVYPIRTSYAHQGDRPLFHSFNSVNVNALHDCLSVARRLTSPSEKEKLIPLAQMADQELWSIAKACKKNSLPFKAIKCISDELSDTEFCERVKTQASFYSEKLLSYFLNEEEILSTTQLYTEQEIDIYTGLHFTKSMQLQRDKLLHQLEIKLLKSKSVILKEINLSEVQLMEMLPKNRANEILRRLSCVANPFMAQLNNKIIKVNEPLLKMNTKLIFHPQYETKSIQLKIDIKNKLHFEKFKTALNNWDYDLIQKLLSGLESEIKDV